MTPQKGGNDVYTVHVDNNLGINWNISGRTSKFKNEPRTWIYYTSILLSRQRRRVQNFLYFIWCSFTRNWSKHLMKSEEQYYVLGEKLNVLHEDWSQSGRDQDSTKRSRLLIILIYHSYVFWKTKTFKWTKTCYLFTNITSEMS